MPILNPNKGKTLQTNVHFYEYNTTRQADLREWRALIEQLRQSNGPVFTSYPSEKKEQRFEGHDGEVRPVTLELDYLFENQWNSTVFRLMDWYEAILPNTALKHGYYLEITPEMRSVREHTLKCGYCAAQYAREGAPSFCEVCIDGEHLKESDLMLLRLHPISERKPDFPPLTEEERADLLPRYTRAQIEGTTKRGKERLAKQRADIASNYEKIVANATAERDGMLWLMDHGMHIDNVIYYDHTGKFGFGWRTSIGPSVRPELEKQLADFPFPYEIK